MKKILLALAGIALLFAIAIVNFGPQGMFPEGLLADLLRFPFGNFGGGRRASPNEPFHPEATQFGIRWFPTYVSFGPDNDTLLVSLCHVDSPGYCRIGRYSLAKDQWDIYAYEEHFSYANPMMSPDGQWLYYTATAACANRRHACDRPRLYRMKPDGTGAELFADTAAVAPSFSTDGKQMIFWGRTTRNAIANTAIHTIDLDTRREVELTDSLPLFGQKSPPFLTADGEHFIFGADLSDWQGRTSCAVDPQTIPADPKTGKRDFGPLFGDKENTGFYLAAIKDAPITKANCYKLTPIWGKESGHPSSVPCAMDGQGRFLYMADLAMKKKEGNPLALALRPADPNRKAPIPLTVEEERKRYPFATLTEEQLRQGVGAELLLTKMLDSSMRFRGESPIAFLRHLEANAMDEAIFDHGCSDTHDSVSSDGSYLAFPWGSVLPTNYNAVAVLKQGAPLNEVRLILNWPKLELTPTLPRSR